jgi:glycolate oxidase iron-sulfur subunit
MSADATPTGRLDLSRPEQLVEYTKTLDCIHCGLCLRTCPTFQLTGSEAASPRGRIHLMRAVAEHRLTPDRDFRDEMEACLLCRHCESVCPAGVEFGQLMEHTRGGLAERRHHRWWVRAVRHVGFRWILPRRFVLDRLGDLQALAQRLGLLGWTRRWLGRRGAFLDAAPAVPPKSERGPLPDVTPAVGESRGAVLMLEGCVMPVFFGRVNRATAESLSRLGYDVKVPRGAVCCGSLHAHNGDRIGARKLARTMLDAWEAAGDALPFVINSAGCGAHLRELAHLFKANDPDHQRALRLQAAVVDFSEFVGPRLLEREALPPDPEIGPVAWDAPCHLCHAQDVRREPLDVLAWLGVEQRRLPDEESCCGSAGIYSLTHPEDSQAVLQPKLEQFADSGAQTLVTANPGCQLQWQAGLARTRPGAQVVHLAELVARALRRE